MRALLFISSLSVLVGCSTIRQTEKNIRGYLAERRERKDAEQAETKRRETPIFVMENGKPPHFDNSDLAIDYRPWFLGGKVNLEFSNKTNEVIKILWDETAFIDADGKTERVLPEGSRYLTRDQSKPPMIIAPSATGSAFFSPVDYVEWTGQFWKENPICETWDSCKGQKFGVLVTYEISGKKKTSFVKFEFVGTVGNAEDRGPASK